MQLSVTANCLNSSVHGYSIPSHLILPYPIPPYPTLSFPVLHCPTLSYPTLSYSTLSYPILSCPALSHPILSYPILSHSILPYLASFTISATPAIHFIITWISHTPLLSFLSSLMSPLISVLFISVS